MDDMDDIYRHGSWWGSLIADHMGFNLRIRAMWYVNTSSSCSWSICRSKVKVPCQCWPPKRHGAHGDHTVTTRCTGGERFASWKIWKLTKLTKLTIRFTKRSKSPYGSYRSHGSYRTVLRLYSILWPSDPSHRLSSPDCRKRHQELRPQKLPTFVNSHLYTFVTSNIFRCEVFKVFEALWRFCFVFVSDSLTTCQIVVGLWPWRAHSSEWRGPDPL